MLLKILSMFKIFNLIIKGLKIYITGHNLGLSLERNGSDHQEKPAL